MPSSGIIQQKLITKIKQNPGVIPLFTITSIISSAIRHCRPFSQASMTPLKLMSLARTPPSSRRAKKTWRAQHQAVATAQQVMAEL